MRVLLRRLSDGIVFSYTGDEKSIDSLSGVFEVLQESPESQEDTDAQESTDTLVKKTKPRRRVSE